MKFVMLDCVGKFLEENSIAKGKKGSDLINIYNMFGEFSKQSELEPDYTYETLVLVKDENGYYINTILSTNDSVRFADDTDDFGGLERIDASDEQDAIRQFEDVIYDLWMNGYDEE